MSQGCSVSRSGSIISYNTYNALHAFQKGSVNTVHSLRSLAIGRFPLSISIKNLLPLFTTCMPQLLNNEWYETIAKYRLFTKSI